MILNCVETETATEILNTRVGLCKIGSDNDTVTGPVVRLYLWKEWNTHTVVDASSTEAFTFSSLLYTELTTNVI
jgi:hypothetical protein